MFDARAHRIPLYFFAFVALTGCSRTGGQADLVWGRRGLQPGDLVRPRAIAIDRDNRIYVVDFTARIQAFDANGKHAGRTWTTPDFRNGRPSGLSIDRDNNLIVSDSHYHCFRIYDADGHELRRIGGTPGSEPWQFGYISDVVQDADGYFYVSEFGPNERITKLDIDGNHVQSWGAKGSALGEFNHVRALAIGPDDLLYAADACNHRIQVFRKDGTFVRSFGQAGKAEGQLSYPYDLAFAPDGTLHIVEYDNHRVQTFTADGKSLGLWGTPGREPGQLHNPWALAVDSRGRVHVVDTENHRVQRLRF